MTSLTLSPAFGTDLLYAIEPFDVCIPMAWRRTATCRVDGDGIEWNGSRVRFDDVVSVSYSSRKRSLNLVQRQMERRVVMATATSRMTIVMGRTPFGPRAENVRQGAYDSIVAALYQSVEPRLRSELLRAMAAGEQVEIGSLVLGSSGITNTEAPQERPMTWDRLPGAFLDGDTVRVAAAISGGPESWTLPMSCANAVLLPELLVEAAEAFA